MAKVINENIVRDFVKALKAERKKPSAYDTTAKVLRVDGDTAWVHIAGGVDETPVKLTVNAEKGDEVQVRVGGGKAWIVGNATAPPTDDKTANIAHKRAVNADNKAIVAKQTAEDADGKATTAKEKADEAIEAVGASITTDTLHYLATSLDSGVTINTPGWTTTVQSMTSTNRYLWTYHTYQKASGQSVNTNPVITGVYGQTGPQGEPGTAGTSITITNIRYAISTTESQPADSSFTYTSVPSVPEGNWLWTRTLYSDNSKVYTKAKQGETGPQGATGDDGVSITAVQPQYNLSTSTSSATGTWSNTLTYETGKYIWTREKITYSNNTVGYSTAIYNEALTSACANAEDALTMAEKIEQHFWTDEDGAHVTEVTQEEYLDDPTNAGGNTLITSGGLSIRNGIEDLAVFNRREAMMCNSDGVPFFMVDYLGGTTTSQKRMSFDDYQTKVQDGIIFRRSEDISSISSGTNIKYYREYSRFILWHQNIFDRSIQPICTNCTIDGFTPNELSFYFDFSDLTAGTDLSQSASITATLLNGHTITISFTLSYEDGITVFTAEKTGETISRGEYEFNVWYGYQVTTVAPALMFGNNDSEQKGDFSSSFGEHLYSSGHHQAVFGKFNVEDANGDYAFIVGNGTADNDRANALAVTWDGAIESGGAKIGSFIKLTGEDNATITLATTDKYPAMSKLVFNWGNTFARDTTNNCIECLYAGIIIVQAKIRLGGNYTAQDIIGYGLYNMDEDTNFAASQFRVPPNMTAPNQDVFTMAMPVVVSAGDRIRIRIRNATGARGRVQNDNTVITATYIAAPPHMDV